MPSTVVATGPFGDVKNYAGRDLYLSWYPAGLVADGVGVAPPEVPPIDERQLLADVIERLAALIPSVGALPPRLDQVRVAGGWVYAAGQGSLADPKATLHRRDQAGIRRLGRYLSVDTGKYSIAPWLAHQVVDALV